MRKPPSMVPLKTFCEDIKLAADTLRKAARSGKYPSYVIGKVEGSWMVDSEEWDKWHREKIH